jgi:hypothetical protein
VKKSLGREGMILAFTAALGTLLAACSDGASPPSPDQPSPWAHPPQVTHAEPELRALGTREKTLERICARHRGDGFATALCGGAQYPQISDLRGLLQSNGLGERPCHGPYQRPGAGADAPATLRCANA